MKVLIGVDGSRDSFVAVEFVARIVSHERDEITLFYAPPEVRIRHDDPEMLERARQALANVVFDEARRHWPSEYQSALRTVVGSGKAEAGLIETARQLGADLIVVGARGAHNITQLLTGSVTTNVVYASPVPVLVVRSPKQKAADGLRVLVACDEPNSAEKIAVLLNQFTWPPDSIGRLMTVIEPQFPGAVPEWVEKRARDADSEAMAQAFIREYEQDKKAKQAELAAWVKRLPPPFQKTEPLLVEGNPAEQILKIAEQEHAELIVMGKKTAGFLTRLLVGSTSRKVFHQAPCSVLLVPLA